MRLHLNDLENWIVLKPIHGYYWLISATGKVFCVYQFLASFLDEVLEMGRNLEVLRQPLEDKVITISRVRGSVTFPANIILVGSLNPCP